MDVLNGTDASSNLIETVGIDDEVNEESPNMTCDGKLVNLDAEEDTVEEIEDDSNIIEDNTTIDDEPQVAAEKIEVAVVTCANDESDADSSLEICFDVNQEEVSESTKVELQIEVDKTTNEVPNEDKDIEEQDQTMEEVAVEEAKKITVEDKEILPEEEVLTNGNASPTGDIAAENGESTVKPASNELALTSDEIVILSDDEADAEVEPATEKPQQQVENNEEKKVVEEEVAEECKNKLPEAEAEGGEKQENVEKITAVAEILEDSNNSDSSNLLEISTVQEEREKERLQEKSGEEDEEDEEEDAEVEAEVEDEETVTENDIEVVESNLDNEMLCSPPAKRSKLSEEKKDDKEEEEQSEKQTVLPEITVELNDLNKIEKMTTQQTENTTELALIETSSEKKEKEASEAEIEDIEMEVAAAATTTTTTETKTADNIVTNELKENGIELSCVKANTLKCVESVPLQFLRKFKKRFESMNRTELEEFVSQKIIETIVYKSQFSELNKLLKQQEQITERHRNHISDLSKQLRDLNMVHNRVLKDLEEHYSQIVLPVKITRAVGLQVCIPKRGEAASSKKEQQQQQKAATVTEEEKTTLSTNSLVPNVAQRTPQSAQKLNKNHTQTAPPFVQTYSHFDANKPSTSSAAKEAAAAAVTAASLQIRKINITTPLVEDTDTGKIMHNTNKKQNSSTKEMLPTTSIPATVYNMQNYMSSLTQLSAGARFTSYLQTCNTKLPIFVVMVVVVMPFK